jgi:DNA-binding NarL/FixJ family response regulator
VTISILLADDQPMLRLGFRLVLDAQDDMQVVGEASDGATALQLVQAKRPDVVLMDVRMPGMDGIEATRHIVADAGTTRVLILTTFDLDEYAYAGLRAGASGFLLKNVLPADLLSAIRVVASGDAVVAPAVTRRLLDAFLPHLPDPSRPAEAALPPGVQELTAREREILTQLAAGLSNAEIARRLVLAEATVKTHVGRVLGKLGLRDRVQAVVYAYEHGLVRPQSRPPRLPQERSEFGRDRLRLFLQQSLQQGSGRPAG